MGWKISQELLEERERDAAPSTPMCDDGSEPKPAAGSSDPNGTMREKYNTPLRKVMKFATLHVESCGGLAKENLQQMMEM